MDVLSVGLRPVIYNRVSIFNIYTYAAQIELSEAYFQTSNVHGYLPRRQTTGPSSSHHFPESNPSTSPDPLPESRP